MNGTRPKSKSAISLLIFIVILMITGSVLGYTLISDNSNSSNPYFVCYDNICCEYKVYNCSESGLENINISIVGNSVIFDQNLSSYCFPPITDSNYFRMDLSLIGNNLTLREIFDPKGELVSRCEHLFKINGSITNIPKGTYNLAYLFENKYVHQVRILDIFNIII